MNMEPYRHTLYRYSTGQGFSVNVDPPENASDVASFQMYPLQENLGRPNFPVDLKREADRISMQVEAAEQQLKVLGYDKNAGKRYRALKSRVDVMQHLMTNYPIRYIIKDDLEKIYILYEKNSPTINDFILKVVEDNKGITGVHDYVGTALKVRKGYPLFDQFGAKLTEVDQNTFDKSEGKHAGFGAFKEIPKITGLIGIAILLAIIFKL